jgi:hypothetical protein
MTSSEPTGEEGSVRTPFHLWVVGVLALLWNLMGAFDYVASQFELEFYMTRFTAEQLAYHDAIPAWAVAGWAFAVWFALVGSISLLARKRCAFWLFVIAFAGMIVSSVYTLGMSNGIEVMGFGAAIFTVVIWIVAIFLIVYSRAQSKSGVLT